MFYRSILLKFVTSSCCISDSETCFPGMITATQSMSWIHFDRIAGGFVNHNTIFIGFLFISCFFGFVEEPLQDVLVHLGAEGVGWALKNIIIHVFSSSLFSYLCQYCKTTAVSSMSKPIATDGGDSENHSAPGSDEPIDRIELAIRRTEEKNTKNDWKSCLMITIMWDYCKTLNWLIAWFTSWSN